MVERGMSGEVVGDRSGVKKAADGTAAGTSGGEAMWAVTFIKELWKKSVWNDAKTVAIATRACAHPSVKVQSAGIHFFLGVEDEEEESESEDEVGGAERGGTLSLADTRAPHRQGPDIKKLNRQRVVKKKTKGDDRRLQKAVSVSNKVRLRQLPAFSALPMLMREVAPAAQKRKEKAAKEGTKVNFPALDLLHDPQRFGEDLYENLHKHGGLAGRRRVVFGCLTRRRPNRQAILARAQGAHHAVAVAGHGCAQALCARLLQLCHQVRVAVSLRLSAG